MITTSQKIANDIAALLRARNSLIWIVTKEEARVERYIHEAAAAAGSKCRTWDTDQGVTTRAGDLDEEFKELNSPDTIMGAIRSRAADLDRRGERCVWILRDMHDWIGGGLLTAPTLRRLRNLARTLPTSSRARAQAVVVVSPSGNIPQELVNHTTVIDWPLPDRDEVAGILDATLENLMTAEDVAKEVTDGKMTEVEAARVLTREKVEATLCRDAAIDAAVGLSEEEIQACYAKSLVKLRCIDDGEVAQEKRRVVAREKVLEWYDPLEGGLDAVGGLENLKAWLQSRRDAYTAEARAYGLPVPKGVFLAGISGCGKSLSAKAIATAWGWPLLRFDMAALKSKFVGDSEQAIRNAFRVIEAIGKCIVWGDELEKALQGATSGSADGGVSADALGAFLTWMQERRGQAVVVATANDVSALPPELMRAGRFDIVFFVDLPNLDERAQVLAAALRAHGRTAKIDLEKVARATEGFTGSEVAELVPDAMYRAFPDGGRQITTADLMDAAEDMDQRKLSTLAADKIQALRNWAKGRAKPANAPQAAPKGARKVASRQIDLG